MRYEWDEEKNLRNQRKHAGVSFELAARVFEDGNCLVYLDRTDETTFEQRWIALGLANAGLAAVPLLVVAHVYREEEHGEEIIRIISARQAEKREAVRYQQQALAED